MKSSGKKKMRSNSSQKKSSLLPLITSSYDNSKNVTLKLDETVINNENNYSPFKTLLNFDPEYR